MQVMIQGSATPSPQEKYLVELSESAGEDRRKKTNDERRNYSANTSRAPETMGKGDQRRARQRGVRIGEVSHRTASEARRAFDLAECISGDSTRGEDKDDEEGKDNTHRVGGGCGNWCEVSWSGFAYDQVLIGKRP